PEQRLEFAVDLRYSGQVRGLTVTLPSGQLPDGFARDWTDRFLREYERQFHSVTRDIAIEIATLRVRGTRHAVRPDTPFRGATGAPRWGRRSVVTRTARVEARVARREQLPAGTRLAGPMVLTQEDTTTWVPPGWDVEVDSLGNLALERSEG